MLARSLLAFPLLFAVATAQTADTTEGSDFARLAFTKVATHWDFKTLKSFANEEWGSDSTIKGWLKIHSSAMGGLKKLSEWKTAKNIEGPAGIKAEQRVQVTGHALFAKGDCNVIVTVRRNQGKWTLSGYRIQSPAVKKAIDAAVAKP